MENNGRSDTVKDFRLERLRRSLRHGPTPAALAVAEKMASSGLAEAQYELSQALLASGRPDNTEAAKGWLQAAADQGHVSACKELWRLLASEQGHAASDRTLSSMIRAADLGDHQASAALILIHGQASNAPIPNMVSYLQRHAERGHAYAQLALAQAYDMGHFGITPDAGRAFELYILAAQQGDAHAQCCVGICYSYGLGVTQDDEQAIRWYKEAARRGSAQAQCNLGYSYDIGRKPCPQSMKEANRWYRRAALRDYSVAQYNLAQSYVLGRGLPQDAGLANRWFARAAQQGYSPARVALGLSYEKGRGVEASQTKAVELYEAAAKAGDAQGQHNYAHMLQNGFGVEGNLTAAFQWYLESAKQGLAVAQDNLATMYLEGSGVGKDLDHALKWRRTAAEQGLANAQYGLAWMYEKGVGIERDATEALRWCEAAAAQGHAGAQRELTSYIAYVAEQQELATAKAALNDLEGRLRESDPAYETKRALLLPILKPVFEQLPPSTWTTTFERAYAGVRLPAANAPPAALPIVARAATPPTSQTKFSHGSMTVLLYQLTSHPDEVGISKVDPPVADGAFFLDFRRPLRVVARAWFGLSNTWIGKVTDLGVPIVHQLGAPVTHEGVRIDDFLVAVYHTDPRFAEIRALWKRRHPSCRALPKITGAGLKILADFALQFPQGC